LKTSETTNFDNSTANSPLIPYIPSMQEPVALQDQTKDQQDPSRMNSQRSKIQVLNQDSLLNYDLMAENSKKEIPELKHVLSKNSKRNR